MPSAGVANDSVGESMELFATTDVDLNGTSISSSTSRTTLTSMNAGGGTTQASRTRKRPDAGP